MIDPAAMIALTRPDVQRQIVETYLAGFEAGYDLAVDLMRAQNPTPVVRGGRDGQGRVSSGDSDDGGMA